MPKDNASRMAYSEQMLYSRTSMSRTLWNHKNMFHTGVVRASEFNHCARSGSKNWDIFSIFITMKSIVCSHYNRFIEAILMSTHNIPFSLQKRNHTKLFQISSHGIFYKRLKNEFAIAVVNEPLVFEPLKFSCSFIN